VKVLVVKLSSLGDVIHTLPALGDAAAALPGIRFDWAVEEAFAEVPRWHGAVDDVIAVALRRWRRRPLRDLLGPEPRLLCRQLRSRRYDAVIDAQGLLKSALVARLVDAPRHGLDQRSAREPLAAGAYHHRIRVPRDLHAVERVRLLFAGALGYAPPAARADYGVRTQRLPDVRGECADLVFIHGSARAEKLWPEAHWEALAVLATSRGYTVALPWGSAAEELRARRIAARANAGRAAAVHVLPRMALPPLASLLRRARGAVAVDTGLGHLCAALDVPTVSLYGPTHSALVGTRGRHQVHLQSTLVGHAPAGARMASLAPTAVWAALENALAGAAPLPRAAAVE